jgi:hypothetical protein
VQKHRQGYCLPDTILSGFFHPPLPLWPDRREITPKDTVKTVTMTVQGAIRKSGGDPCSQESVRSKSPIRKRPQRKISITS